MTPQESAPPFKGLELIGPITPYTYIGDSHAGAIGSLLFHAEDEYIVTRLYPIWRFVPADFIGEDKLLGESVSEALRRSGALHSFHTFPQIDGFRPVRTWYGSERRVENIAPTEHANNTPYVFSVGEIASRYVLSRLISESLDFATPFATDGLARLSPIGMARRTLSAEEMLRLLVAEYQPLFRGLQILRNVGLRTIFLHSITPPPIDDEYYFRVLNQSCPGQLRYKLAMFVNYMYRRVCADLGVTFIDAWPHVTENDVVRPEFYLDGMHLNQQHSVVSVKLVHRAMQTALRNSDDAAESTAS